MVQLKPLWCRSVVPRKKVLLGVKGKGSKMEVIENGSARLVRVKFCYNFSSCNEQTGGLGLEQYGGMRNPTGELTPLGLVDDELQSSGECHPPPPNHLVSLSKTFGWSPQKTKLLMVVDYFGESKVCSIGRCLTYNTCATAGSLYIGAREMYAARLLPIADTRRLPEPHVCLYEPMRTTGFGGFICFDCVIQNEHDIVGKATECSYHLMLPFMPPLLLQPPTKPFFRHKA